MRRLNGDENENRMSRDGIIGEKAREGQRDLLQI